MTACQRPVVIASRRSEEATALTGFQVGAAIIAALSTLNFIVFAVRRGTRPRDVAEAPAPVLRTTATGGEPAIYVVSIAWLMFCFGAAKVAPDSALGHAMVRPWALACNVAWTMAGALVCSVVVTLWRRRRLAANG